MGQVQALKVDLARKLAENRATSSPQQAQTFPYLWAENQTVLVFPQKPEEGTGVKTKCVFLS